MRIRNNILAAEKKYNRPTGAVSLLAVTKGQSVCVIEEALKTGQTHFGENYLQETLTKMTELKNEKIIWHFIGAIQSNKTKLIAQNFSWVHTIDRFSIAEKLSQHRAELKTPLNICLQVNIDQEPQKAGVLISELSELAHAVVKLPFLNLRGLMAIPAPKDLAAQHLSFQHLNKALQMLNQEGLKLDTLSMGMSDDYEAAIAEGATIVRIGTELFGTRLGVKS